MIRIEQQAGALNKAMERMAKRQKALQDPTPAYRKAAIFLDQWTQKNLNSDGGKVGGWTPLAEMTKEIKKAAGKEKMMVFTGLLRRSLASGWGSDRKKAWIKSDVPYSEDHQYGLPWLPKRQIIPEPDDVKADMRQIVGDWVRLSIKKD